MSDFDSLRSAANELLHARHVFDIDAYGWLNADDVDPDLLGYAMWTMSPPYDHDFDSWQRNKPPTRAPTDVEQRLMELGHDFFGLMKAARHFIGFALLTQPAVETLRIEGGDFDFNEFAALVTLTSASDRLRDFMIVATQEKRTEDRDRLVRAIELVRASGLNQDADRLTTEYVAVRKVREVRNVAAHGLGTEPARVQRRLIEMDRKAFVDRTWRQRDDSVTRRPHALQHWLPHRRCSSRIAWIPTTRTRLSRSVDAVSGARRSPFSIFRYPSPLPDEWEWIAAHRHWVRGGR